MKRLNQVSFSTVVAVLAVFLLSTSMALATGHMGGDAAKKVTGKEHRLLFPDGHSEPKTGCYYDEEEDVYLCSYNAPVKVDKNTKMMHQGGEPAFKKVPKAQHKAHSAGLPCYYDEEEAVYFCAHAE